MVLFINDAEAEAGRGGDNQKICQKTVKLIFSPSEGEHSQWAGDHCEAGFELNWIGNKDVICMYWNYWIQTSQTGDKPYGDPTPYSECFFALDFTVVRSHERFRIGQRQQQRLLRRQVNRF